MKKTVLSVFFMFLLVNVTKSQPIKCLENSIHKVYGGTEGNGVHFKAKIVITSLEDGITILGLRANQKLTINKGDTINILTNRYKSYEEQDITNCKVMCNPHTGEPYRVQLNSQRCNLKNISYSYVVKGKEQIGTIQLTKRIETYMAMP